MKNVKKKTMFFGAVVVALLMVSSVTAVNVPQVDESEELESEKIVDELVNYVYPDIYLSGQEELNILLEALDLLDFDDDPDFYLLLQGIVAVMNSKGYVDSSDIEQIINDNDLEVGSIGVGAFVTGGPHEPHSSSGGYVNCLRRPLCIGIVPIPVIVLLHFDVRYQNVGFWQIYYPQITIGSRFIDWNIVGNAIGYVGIVGNEPLLGFNSDGTALLIRYRNAITDNQDSQSIPQSNPQSTPTSEQNQLENNQPTNTPSSQQTTVLQQIKQLIQNIIINIKLRYQTTNI